MGIGLYNDYTGLGLECIDTAVGILYIIYIHYIYYKYIYIYPYGSKHCLRKYLSLQIIVNYTPNTS